jgi:hypothetical protein
MVWQILYFGDGFPFPLPGWERSQQGPYRRYYGAEGGGEFGVQGRGGGCWFGEWFQRLRVQHLAADWVDQQPMGGHEIYTKNGL